jgi:hypothetical protein
MRARFKILVGIVTVIAIGIAVRYAIRERHFSRLDERSSQVADRLIALLSRNGDTVLATALPFNGVPQSSLCILHPYSERASLPELQAVDLGIDDSWLQMVEEQWIAIVIIDNQGRLLDAIRLPRMRVDLLPHDQPKCYPFESVRFAWYGYGPSGNLEMTVAAE